jgi:type IV pilus assembly protein PilM
MFNFKTRKNVIALDIGESSIKLIELLAGEGRPVVVAAAIEEMAIQEEAALETSTARRQRVSAALSRLLKRLNIVPAKVPFWYSTLPSGKVNIKQIKSVPLAKDELDSSLYFEARKHVPVEGEVLMDYQVVAETASELDILLCVSSRDVVQEHLSLLAESGIRGAVVDASPLATVNGWLLNPESDLTPETVLFINLGASLTHLSIFRRKGLFFVRDLPVAGNHLTKELSDKLRVSMPEAEALKRQHGVLQQSANSVASEGECSQIGFAESDTTCNVQLDTLVREINRSIRFYAKETGQSQIDRVYLCGGGALDTSLKVHLESALHMQCTPFDPFKGLNVKCEIPVQGKELFTQAMGMAFRGINELLSNQSK